MFSFVNSKLSVLISSFDDFELKSKKYSKSQTRAFSDLQKWAFDTNNTAIQDVTNKLDILFSKMDIDLNKDKLNSIKEANQMFKKFKEYDSKKAKLFQKIKMSEKYEKKCFKDLSKCPLNKNIRDYENRFTKAKHQREIDELKYYQYSQEIDATKTILFKTQMKRLNETLMRQNEAEKILLNAMNSLLEKIPDVSNEEVDDINLINYKGKMQTQIICTQAKRKLTRLSSAKLANIIKSPCSSSGDLSNQAQVILNVEDSSKLANGACECVEQQQYENSFARRAIELTQPVKRPKTRISCPPKFILGKIDETNRLYPFILPAEGSNENLQVLNNKENSLPPIPPPPPTYSDSESFYSNTRSNKIVNNDVEPSAPAYISTSS